MKRLLIITTLLASLTCWSQNNVYEWREEMTNCKGWYDTTEYSYGQLDSIHLYLMNWPSEISGAGNVWEIDQIDSISTKELDDYFTQRMHLYYSINLPEGAFWDSLSMCRKKELKSLYAAHSEFLKGFQNPEFLLDPTHPDCEKYAIILNGNDETILSEWKTLIEKMKKNNGYPDLLEAEYQSQLNSPQKIKYARLDLMKYGWWNCRNQYIYYHEDYLRIKKEFEKLFIRVEHFNEE